MTHDPLCPPQAIRTADPCHYCDLIAKVRQDMAMQYLVTDREQQEAEERAYAKGRADAARDVAALLRSWGRVTDPDAQELLVTAARGGTDE